MAEGLQEGQQREVREGEREDGHGVCVSILLLQVTILKLAFNFEDSQKLLPSELQVATVSGEREEIVKTVAVSDSAAALEFVFEEKDEVQGMTE